MFCADCLAGLQTCPMCRAPLQGHIGVTANFIRAQLDALKVVCVMCDEVMERSSFPNHKKKMPRGYEFLAAERGRTNLMYV